MEWSLLIVALAALSTALLTFYSGFGLGTLLMPVLALFMPVPLAIAVTAVVHMLNNLTKFALIGRAVNGHIFWRFGLPAMLAAFGGAFLLNRLQEIPPVFEYMLLGGMQQVTILRLVVGGLILLFCLLEGTAWLKMRLTLMTEAPWLLSFGGLLSGFFGGLSGHQGMFRAMFLLQGGLTKEGFIATNVAIAVAVDIIRLSVYGRGVLRPLFEADALMATVSLLVVSVLAALTGSLLGRRWLHKITFERIQHLVTAMLVFIAFGLMSGLI